MDRRTFISDGIIISAGCAVAMKMPLLPLLPENKPVRNLYEIFKTPELKYHPFVRWWWNGDKVEAGELIRELRLLKAAGIGGVEINPVEFPKRFDGDDLGKPSLKWLSSEWIDMLKVVFDEAKSLGMTCDLIVGSGWPFGAENLEKNERSQIVVIAVKKLTGPADYEISKFEIFREADPAVSSPFPGRLMDLLNLFLVPDPVSDVRQIIDLSSQVEKESVRITIPDGKYALYGLVKITGFMQVINGAPGATGPVLDHYNKDAVRKYLLKMSGEIEKRTGSLSQNIRALFTDSMELEGSNWTDDMLAEFQKRRGYDIYKYLPFVLFKTGAMGNVTDFKYGAALSPEMDSMIQRMRYDFELTKNELIEERFIKTYTEWCRGLNVKSRAQAYGRGFFPLEGSFDYDIPESESWTTNWLKHRPGEEMPEDDYRRGRAYTMINKYVSSAANLKGKRLVSCEEMTDTYTVFNTTLENLKIGGDQTAITGVNQTIFHGFNYSPPDAPYPGWIRYGGYYSEKNTWWPWFHLYNEYKARLSALLQNVTMYTDIAILPPLDDMWSLIGAQMEPFPNITHIDYFTLIWEAINKNGCGCDYISQRVISEAEMKNGLMLFGPRKYKTIFLVHVDSLHPLAAKKLFEFVNSGGRIFCIETVPSKSPGWNQHSEADADVNLFIAKMKNLTDNFILLKKPENDFIGWFEKIQEQYEIKPYIKIQKPDPFVYQNRYQSDDGTEVIYLINSNINLPHKTVITFSKEITSKRFCWKWDPETGEKFRIYLDKGNSINLDIGPAESMLFIFDREKQGIEWKPLPEDGFQKINLSEGWSAEFRHCHDGTIKNVRLDTLRDLKENTEFSSFAGEIIYRNSFVSDNHEISYLNTGKVFGLCELSVNGITCGTRWYGRRIFSIKGTMKKGKNEIEIKVVTTMGNYMKSLTDNPIAQYWTNEKSKVQPVQSIGLIGPVVVYT